MTRPIALLILALLLAGLPGCTDALPIKSQFDSWWGSLTEVEREAILREKIAEPSRYRVVLHGKDAEDPVLLAFAEWVNGLQPAQIEAFERYLFANQVERRVSAPEKAGEILDAVSGPNVQIIRPVYCTGAMVRKRNCTGGTECFACVAGLSADDEE
jgi:hypothetical protein